MKLRLIILSLLLSPQLWAQGSLLNFIYPKHNNTFIIDQHADSLPESLLEKVQVLEDESTLLKVEEAYMQHREHFLPLDGNRLLPLATHWVRISLFNSNYEAGAWMLHLGLLDHAEVWLIHEQGAIEHLEVGLFRKIMANGPWHDGAASIPIAIPERQTVTVLARVNPITNRMPHLALELERKDRWLGRWQNMQWLVHICVGLGMLAISLAASAALMRQKPETLWFALFFLLAQAWAVHQYGYLRFAFWDASPIFNYHLGIALLWALPIFYWLYARKALQISSHLPMIWAGIRAFMAIAGTAAGADAMLEWIGLPSFAIDLLLLLYCYNMEGKRLHTPLAYSWLVGSSLFFIAGLAAWVWEEWFFSNLGRTDLLLWLLGTVAMLTAFTHRLLKG